MSLLVWQSVSASEPTIRPRLPKSAPDHRVISAYYLICGGPGRLYKGDHPSRTILGRKYSKCVVRYRLSHLRYAIGLWTINCEWHRDPLANSFVAPLTADISDDTRLSVEDFDRSPSDDEEYGIDHLRLHESSEQQASNSCLQCHLYIS